MTIDDPDRRRLEHILDHIERAQRYASAGRAAFDADEMRRDAVIRCVAVVGEAAGALTPEVYRQIGALPPGLPKSQRNLLVHEYWRVDPDVVWATVQEDLPGLAEEVRSILSE